MLPKHSLVDRLRLIPQERLFIKSPALSKTYGELQSDISSFEESNMLPKGARCAIVADSRIALAANLISISHLASMIFLQPNHLEREVVQAFYDAAGIEYVVTLEAGNVSVENIEGESAPIDKRQREHSHNSYCTWLLATSGTSGNPKLASYTLEALTSTVQKNWKRGADYTWGLCYDLNRFAGLQVFFQALIGGSSLVVAETGIADDKLTKQERSMDEIINDFADFAVNTLSATPSFWRKLLMCPAASRLTLQRVTLGGEIATQSLLNALKKKYADARITHIYASTEAGVGFAVKDGKEGFPVAYLKDSTDSAIKLKIEAGTLWLHSDRGASKLLLGELAQDAEGYIDSGDMVEIGEERIFFLGRSSGAINVGGNKVVPEDVEKILNTAPDVVLARVYAKDSPVMGMLVAAEIVLTDTAKDLDKKPLKSAILRHCRSQLEPFKVPAIVKFVDVIKVNESGKVVR